jgi:hypothetical protein
VDSHHDLGVNSPSHERVTYRKATTCAPLQTTAYAQQINGSDVLTEVPEDTLLPYFYGRFGTNWTYEYNEHTIIDGIGYTIQYGSYLIVEQITDQAVLFNHSLNLKAHGSRFPLSTVLTLTLRSFSSPPMPSNSKLPLTTPSSA